MNNTTFDEQRARLSESVANDSAVLEGCLADDDRHSGSTPEIVHGLQHDRKPAEHIVQDQPPSLDPTAPSTNGRARSLSQLRPYVQLKIALIRLRTRRAQYDCNELYTRLQHLHSCPSSDSGYSSQPSVDPADSQFSATDPHHIHSSTDASSSSVGSSESISSTDDEDPHDNAELDRTSTFSDVSRARVFTTAPWSHSAGKLPWRMASNHSVSGVSPMRMTIRSHLLDKVASWTQKEAALPTAYAMLARHSTMEDDWTHYHAQLVTFHADVERATAKSCPPHVIPSDECSEAYGSIVSLLQTASHREDRVEALLTQLQLEDTQQQPDCNHNQRGSASTLPDNINHTGLTAVDHVLQHETAAGQLPRAQEHDDLHNRPQIASKVRVPLMREVTRCFCPIQGCCGTDHDICDLRRGLWSGHDIFFCTRCCHMESVPIDSALTKLQRHNRIRTGHGCHAQCAGGTCDPSGTSSLHTPGNGCVSWQAMPREDRYIFIYQLLQQLQQSQQQAYPQQHRLQLRPLPASNAIFQRIGKFAHESTPRLTKRKFGKRPVTSESTDLIRENQDLKRALVDAFNRHSLELQATIENCEQQRRLVDVMHQQALQKVAEDIRGYYRAKYESDKLALRNDIDMRLGSPSSPPLIPFPLSITLYSNRMQEETDSFGTIYSRLPPEDDLVDDNTYRYESERQTASLAGASSAQTQQPYGYAAQSTDAGTVPTLQTQDTDVDMLDDTMSSAQALTAVQLEMKDSARSDIPEDVWRPAFRHDVAATRHVLAAAQLPTTSPSSDLAAPPANTAASWPSVCVPADHFAALFKEEATAMDHVS